MAEAQRLRIEPLDPTRHDRLSFASGVEPLDRYLHTQAAQDARRRVAAPYVLVQSAEPDVLGYYTLSNLSLQAVDLPSALTRKLPRYPVLPATLLGRLAVDTRARGNGYGGLLLLNAMERCLNSGTASMAVVVDAKDDGAAEFYRRYAFLPLVDQPRRMFKPMSEIALLFA